MVYTQDEIILERCEKFLSNTYWTDVNLRSQLLPQIFPINSITCIRFSPDEPHFNIKDIIPMWDAYDQYNNDSSTGIYQKQIELCKVGDIFGPSWSTVWFRLQFHIPSSLMNKCIGLKWDSSSEAFLFNEKKEYLQAFTGGNGPDRRDLYIFPTNDLDLNDTSSLNMDTNSIMTMYVEMACNGMFGNGLNGMIKAPDPNKTFQLNNAELVEINQSAFELFWQLSTLNDLATHSKDLSIKSTILTTINFILNTINIYNINSIQSCINKANEIIFIDNNSYKLNHEIVAIGHCHIDTAWLWTYKETRRKIYRSWATQLQLLTSNPTWKFVASQTVQWEWLQTDHPDLFDRVKKAVITEGRFIPIGGTYVEFDANIPSCESMIRQFLYGTAYLKKEFDVTTDIFWLPDTFGYSAQLPQIMSGFNIKYFLSQKLSWNLFNKFPHTSFEWIGLDGTKVIAHFPPADTYNSSASAHDCFNCISNHKSLKSSNRSLLLFGHGDGGGGPSISHLQSIQLLQKSIGVPTINLNASPSQFFQSIENDHKLNKSSVDIPKWYGELYLELHQGTLTSQATVKKQNRQCEKILRTVDALFVFIIMYECCNKEFIINTKNKIEILWKTLLLNQFHDVIPGSSITAVYEDCELMLSSVLTESQLLIQAFLNLLLPYSMESTEIFLNMTNYTRNIYQSSTGTFLHIEPYAFAFQSLPKVIDDSSLYKPSAKIINNGYLLENIYLKVEFNATGAITSFIDKRSLGGREIIADNSKGNNLMLYEDIPFFWDAWDLFEYHKLKGSSINTSEWISTSILQSQTICESFIDFEDAKSCVSIVFKLSGWSSAGSTIIQRVYLSAEDSMLCFDLEVDWRESHKILKVEFPFAILAKEVSYEVQAGFVTRPTHRNSPYDSAQFEVCGHGYADISEADFGVSLLNDCKYGYSGVDSTLSLSLLRSPKSPDPNCDMKILTFSYAVYPHNGGSIYSGKVNKAASNFNNPVGCYYGSVLEFKSQLEYKLQERMSTSLFKVVGDEACGLGIDSLKVSEDLTGYILRLIEVCGTRGRASILSAFSIRSVRLVNMMENCIQENIKTRLAKISDNHLALQYEPFRIITLFVVAN